MKQINLTITALSPLAIGSKKPGSVSEAGEYIPGTVIRGAIASQIIRQSGLSKDSDFSTDGGHFKTLFLDDNAAIFHNAYPAKHLLPATAVSSKIKPGFKGKGNGVFDTLIDRFLAEQYNHPYDPNCPVDGGRVEPFSGFYNCLYNTYKSYSASKRLLTRVGINRKRNVSQDNLLYSLEVVDEVSKKINLDKVPIRYSGTLLKNHSIAGLIYLSESKEIEKKPYTYYSSILVKDDDNLAETLKDFIEVNKNDFRVGGSKSRGLGKIEIKAEIETITLEEKIKEVRSRIEQFNEKLNRRRGDWSIFGSTEAGDPEKKYFTINLQADTILSENWLKTTVITKDILSSTINIESNKLELETAYSSYGYVSGWNSAWGLMKDMELITNKGGLYLFSINNLDDCIEALTNLELAGIGDKTNEGFGKIKICDPFHLKLRESLLDNN